MVPIVSGQQLESVRENIDDGFEALRRPPRRTGDIDHQGIADCAGAGTGERCHGSRVQTSGDHCVNKPRGLPLQYVGRGFGCDVTQSEPCAPRCDHQLSLSDSRPNRLGNRLAIVGHEVSPHRAASLHEELLEYLAGTVLANTSRHTIADGDYNC